MAVLLLTACATTEPAVKVVTQRVEIPIAVPCAVDMPVKPKYNFDSLTEEQDIFDKTKATLADRHLSAGYEKELEAALKACK